MTWWDWLSDKFPNPVYESASARRDLRWQKRVNELTRFFYRPDNCRQSDGTSSAASVSSDVWLSRCCGTTPVSALAGSARGKAFEGSPSALDWRSRDSSLAPSAS